MSTTTTYLPFQTPIIKNAKVNSSHHGAVGNAFAWQTRGLGFEPVLMCYSFSGKYPGA